MKGLTLHWKRVFTLFRSVKDTRYHIEGYMSPNSRLTNLSIIFYKDGFIVGLLPYNAVTKCGVCIFFMYHCLRKRYVE